MPAPPVGSDLTYIEYRVRDIIAGLDAEGGGLASIPQRAIGAVEEMGAVVGEISTAGEGVSAAGLTTAAAEGLVTFAGLSLLGMVLALYMLGNWLRDTLLSFSGAIPLGQGGHYRTLVRIAFYPTLGGVDGTIWLAQHILPKVLPAAHNLVQWSLQNSEFNNSTATGALITAAVEPVHREVDHLWGWVQAIANDIGTNPIAATSSGAGSPDSSASALSRLDAIEARNARQGQEISQLNQRMTAMEAGIAQLQHEVVTIRSTLFGVRAANVGASDVFQQLEQLQATIEQVQQQQGALLSSHTAELAQLAPLLSLEYLGERGLENLRTLERDMCQCPRLPRVGFITPDLLAMEQVLAHGL